MQLTVASQAITAASEFLLYCKNHVLEITTRSSSSQSISTENSFKMTKAKPNAMDNAKKHENFSVAKSQIEELLPVGRFLLC